MADRVGEIFIPTPEFVRDQFLSDLRLGAISEGLAEPPTTRKTDNWNFATAIGNVSAIGLQNMKIGIDNASVLHARRKALDDIRKSLSLPEVEPEGSTGKVRPVINGATTISAGTILVLGNGSRFEVVGSYVSPSDGDEIDVSSLDIGSHTNAEGGEPIRFVTPPSNVEAGATVSHSSPLTNGTDEESDERKRTRILNKLQSGAAGSWGHIRQLVLDNDASISNCFVYPAPGGPASTKVVPVRNMSPDTKEFTRVCSAGQLLKAREELFENLPDGMDVVVQAAVDQAVDFGIELQIPSASIAEGGGGGWVDPSPWPTLVGADNGRVEIDGVAQNGSQITVSANTTTSPSAHNTNVAWWSSVDKTFVTSLVTAVSGSAGAWVLTLQTPFRDSNGDPAAVGEFISPAAENLAQYGEAWVDLFNTFGPGENTTDAAILARAFRHPRITREAPASWSDQLISTLAQSYPEITDNEREYASATTATVPGSIDTGPSILIPGNLGFYPLQ